MKHTSLLLLAFLLGFGTLSYAQDQQPSVVDDHDEVYLSFRYQGVINEIVVAYYDGDRFYLPFTELFDLLGINYELGTVSFAVSGFYITPGNNYSIDFSRRVAEYDTLSVEIGASDYFLKEIDYYVVPEVFEEIFNLKFKIDLSRLALQLESKTEMPVVTRKKQRARNELRAKYSSIDFSDYTALTGREPRTLDGALADYSLFSTVSNTASRTNLNLSIGGEVLFGDFQGNLITLANQDTITFAPSSVRWRYVNELPYFSNVSLGEISSGGLQSQTFHGVHVSNDPITPRHTLDNYFIDGTTDPEAEVELYQNNRLVETLTADDVGYYRFVVPLTYGTSEYKLRIYAKQGRVIELDHRIQVPFNFLPQGEIQYHLNSGRLAQTQVPWNDQPQYLQSDASYGFKNWLTAGVGIEYLADANQDKPILYSRISSRVAGDMLVGVELAKDNFYRFNSRGLGPNSSSWSAEFTAFEKNGYYNSFDYKHLLNANLFYPFSIGNSRYTGHLSNSWVRKGDDSDRLSVKGDVNQFLGPLRLRYGFSEQHNFGSGGHTNSSLLELGSVYILPRIPSIHPLLRGSYFRNDISISTSLGRVEELSSQVVKQLNGRMRAQLLVINDFVSDNLFFELGFTMDLEKVRSTTSVRSTRSSSSFGQTLRGSVGLDRNTGTFIWDNRQQVGRSGISVKMFVDENNSDTYDEGEEVIPGSAITLQKASARKVKTDGVERLTQLQPYRRYYFQVNEAKINNATLMAKYRKFSIVTDPNRFKQIEIPFFTSGIIEGRVDRIRDGEFVPISGLRIHVKNDDGTYSATLRTFSDGSFYSMEIPPGTYEAQIDDSQLKFLGMTSSPETISFTVKADPNGDYIEGLNFLLE